MGDAGKTRYDTLKTGHVPR